MFFYLCKVLFSGFLEFRGNFVDGRNSSKYRDVAPLRIKECHFTFPCDFVGVELDEESFVKPRGSEPFCYKKYKLVRQSQIVQNAIDSSGIVGPRSPAQITPLPCRI